MKDAESYFMRDTLLITNISDFIYEVFDYMQNLIKNENKAFETCYLEQTYKYLYGYKSFH